MKTIKAIGLIIPLIAITVFILVLNSCKKADYSTQTTIDEKTMANIKANVASQMKKEGGIPQIFTRKQPVTTYWADQFGKAVTKEQMENNNFTSACGFNTPAYCDLVQYARVYRCASTSNGAAGYFLQFEFEISWDNNIVKLDNYGNRTSGFADIVDAGGVTVQSLSFDNTNSDVQIVEIGPDGSNPGNYIFRVKFVTTDMNPGSHLVAETYINSGNYDVEFSAMFVTDCKNGGGSPYSLWTMPVTTYGFTGASGNDPCKRNDKVWGGVGPSASSQWSVVGYTGSIGVTCSFGGSFLATDLQEVEYNIDGGTWTAMDNYTATSLPIFGLSYIRGGDFCRTATLPSGNHLVGLRYRNWRYINSSPWSVPNITNDCMSYENPSLPTTPVNQRAASSWAYQYWPY